jgi:hypothetical protein
MEVVSCTETLKLIKTELIMVSTFIPSLIFAAKLNLGLQPNTLQVLPSNTKYEESGIDKHSSLLKHVIYHGW